MAAASSAVANRNYNAAKVHPGGGDTASPAHKYIEEDDASVAANKAIRTASSSSLGDEDRALYVTDTTVIDPRYEAHRLNLESAHSLALARFFLVFPTCNDHGGCSR